MSSSQWGCAMSCAPHLTPRMICTPGWIDETSMPSSYPHMTNISVTHRPVTYSARLKAAVHREQAARPSKRSTPVPECAGTIGELGVSCLTPWVAPPIT